MPNRDRNRSELRWAEESTYSSAPTRSLTLNHLREIHRELRSPWEPICDDFPVDIERIEVSWALRVDRHALEIRVQRGSREPLYYLVDQYALQARDPLGILAEALRLMELPDELIPTVVRMMLEGSRDIVQSDVVRFDQISPMGRASRRLYAELAGRSADAITRALESIFSPQPERPVIPARPGCEDEVVASTASNVDERGVAIERREAPQKSWDEWLAGANELLREAEKNHG